MQAGARCNGVDDDTSALQACIDYIEQWNTNTDVDDDDLPPDYGHESSRSAIKLVVPANRTFLVDAVPPPEEEEASTTPVRLMLKGPITIEGEDRYTSRIRLKEAATDSATPVDVFDTLSEDENAPCLFLAKNLRPADLDPDNPARGVRVAFRNFTMEGSFGTDTAAGESTDHGLAQLVKFNDVDELVFDDMVFRRSRAVVVGGDGVRKLTMRDCLMEQNRRGGLVVTRAENSVVEDNDFRWVGDDPVAITVGTSTAVYDPEHPETPPVYIDTLNAGIARIVGNRVFGSRGLNVVGAKNVLIADNSCVLCRGRAIHIGTTTFQQKGDTTMLDVIVRNNIITDLLDAAVDPDQEEASDGSAHRAIDIELLQAGVDAHGSIPGLPNASGTIVGPALYHYQAGQGLQGRRTWQVGQHYKNTDASPKNETWWLGRVYRAQNEANTGSNPPTHTGSTIVYDGGGTSGVGWLYVAPAAVVPPTHPTPHSANILIEGNIISRSRTPAVASGDDHVDGINLFADYGVGPWGGFERVFLNEDDEIVEVTVTRDEITPDQGIAVSGSARNLIIRGNQIRNCEVGVLLYGKHVLTPLSLWEVTIVDNDFSDWRDSAIRFKNFDFDDGTNPAVVPGQRVSILSNRADGDPLHQNGNARNGNGTWKNTDVGTFISALGVGMLFVVGNHLRNVSKVIAGYSNALHAMQDNVGYCDPYAVGYHANNVGIGNIIEPQHGWRYVIEGGNPSLSSYGMLISACALAVTPTAVSGPVSALPPSGGKWVAGTFVRNLLPVPITSGGVTFEISGWRRMTTGSGNVLNTDWRQQRVLTA